VNGKPYRPTSKDPEVEAELLYNMGYRQVSRRYGMIARVEVPDLVTAMKAKMPHSKIENWKPHVREYHWLRYFSKDVVRGVPEPVMAALRRMCGGMWGKAVAVESDTVPIAVCRDNTGMEDSFDRGVDYVVSPCVEKGFIRVYDKRGIPRKCFRGRFSPVVVGK